MQSVLDMSIFSENNILYNIRTPYIIFYTQTNSTMKYLILNKTFKFTVLSMITDLCS